MTLTSIFKKMPLPIRIAIFKAIAASVNALLRYLKKGAMTDIAALQSTNECTMVITRKITEKLQKAIELEPSENWPDLLKAEYGWDVTEDDGVKALVCTTNLELGFDKGPFENRELICCIVFKTRNDMMLFKLAYGGEQ